MDANQLCPECGGSGTWPHPMGTPGQPFHHRDCSRAPTPVTTWPRVFIDGCTEDGWLRVVTAPGAGGRAMQFRQLARIMSNDDTWQALVGLLMEATSDDDT